MSNEVPPAGRRPAFRAGQAFQQLIETDPEARAAWERTQARIEASIREMGGPILAGLESAFDRLETRHFGLPESLECAISPPKARPPGTEPLPEANLTGKLTPEGKALAAAYALKRDGRPVTVKAAAKRAGVDRSHLYHYYPGVVRLIKALGTPDGRLPRGSKDRHTGNLEAADDEED